MFRRARLIASAAALLIGAILVRIAPEAKAQVQNYQPIRTLYDFTAADAGNPTVGLIMDKAGNLYGTESGGNGAVFELSPPPTGAPYKAWKKKTLYSFKGGDDGYNPWVSLFLDASGNLYGATRFGGGIGCSDLAGCGTIFELSPPSAGQTAWTETVLHRFTGGDDGAAPDSSLITDAAGNLYGTTARLVDADCYNAGCGRVFKLSRPVSGESGWNFQVIFSISAPYPLSGIVFDAQGNLYGAEELGAFKLSPPAAGQSAWTETDIASSGSYLNSSGLTFDSQGNLYGVTNESFGNSLGTVYQLSPPAKGTRWGLNIIARFNGSDGFRPETTPLADANGNVFGVAYGGHGFSKVGGAHGGDGVVYEVTGNDTLVVLHKFDNGRAGVTPGGPVLLDAAGNIYGVSSGSGTTGKGAVWEIPAPAQ